MDIETKLKLKEEKLLKKIEYHNTHCRICNKEMSNMIMIPCSFCGTLCCDNCIVIHENKCEYSGN